MKIKRWFFAAAISVFVGVGCSALCHQHLLANSEPYLRTQKNVEERDVAIVLGAGMKAPGVPGAVLVDRLQLAADLYRNKRVEKIIVTGDNDGIGIDEVNPMRKWLMAHGVPSKAIYMDHAGFRTHDSMQRAAQIFEVKSAIVCTQQFHLARSVYLARSAGIDALGVPANERRWKTNKYARTREFAARVKAVVDVAIGLSPKYLGESIPIASTPAEATHD